ncbi:hypothetical protein Mapa_009412 [Marchantia paleacea]|nr:hypothetical protein Mapa_009412 [Marchantia paleacea]
MQSHATSSVQTPKNVWTLQARCAAYLKNTELEEEVLSAYKVKRKTQFPAERGPNQLKPNQPKVTFPCIFTLRQTFVLNYRG